MSEKKPQAGEWWRHKHDGNILFVIGADADGDIVTHDRDGDTLYIDAKRWEHLPDCTGFDWVPEVFPQYWTTKDSADSTIAYVIRTGPHPYEWQWVDKAGNVDNIDHCAVWNPMGRTQMSKEQAEALIKPPKPVESPDDWVTQDRVPDRPGIDEWQWVYSDGVNSGWTKSRIGQGRYEMHGIIEDGDAFEVRCRRKDLPPLPPQSPTKPSGIEAIVCRDITDRQKLGIAKYGQTVADNPLSLREWLEHAYQECLDQAVYLRRAMEECR